MNSFWMASYIALWLVVLLLSLVVVLLARQVGLIYRRLGPRPARIENEGPDLESVAPQVQATDINGETIIVGRSAQKKYQLLVFISGSCPSCERLAPAIAAVHLREREVETVIISLLGDEPANRGFMRKHKLEQVPFVVSLSVAQKFSVLHPPYAVLLDDLGTVKAKGVVNDLDHLESLLHVVEFDASSTQPPVRNVQQELLTVEH